VSDYASIASQVLPVARDFLGTSERYGALAAQVGQTVAARGGDGAGLSAALSAGVNATDSMHASVVAIGERQVDELVGLRNELRRLSATLEATITRKQASAA
jgi:hypothetical protein